MEQLSTRQGTAGNGRDPIAGQGGLEEAAADLVRRDLRETDLDGPRPPADAPRLRRSELWPRPLWSGEASTRTHRTVKGHADLNAGGRET